MVSQDSNREIERQIVLCFRLALIGIVTLVTAIVAILIGRRILQQLRRDGKPIGHYPKLVVGMALSYAVLLFASILGIVALNSLLDGYKAANEVAVIRTLRDMQAGIRKYYEAQGDYPGALDELRREGYLSVDPTARPIHGYTFTYSVKPEGRGGMKYFSIQAAPRWRYLDGKTHFYVDQTGLIRMNDHGKADHTSKPLS